MNVLTYILNSAGWAFVGYAAAVLNHHLRMLHRHLTGENGNNHGHG